MCHICVIDQIKHFIDENGHRYMVFISEHEELFHVYGNGTGFIVVEKRAWPDKETPGSEFDRKKHQPEWVRKYDCFTRVELGYRLFDDREILDYFDLVTTSPALLHGLWSLEIRLNDGKERDWNQVYHEKNSRGKEMKGKMMVNVEYYIPNMSGMYVLSIQKELFCIYGNKQGKIVVEQKQWDPENNRRLLLHTPPASLQCLWSKEYDCFEQYKWGCRIFNGETLECLNIYVHANIPFFQGVFRSHVLIHKDGKECDWDEMRHKKELQEKQESVSKKRTFANPYIINFK